jgi:hypothetical protein
MPTTVPPGAELQQEVYPDDCFGFKRHVTTKMFLPAERTDAEFQLVIAVTIGDGVVPVSQTFRVSEVRVEQERQVRGDEP